MSLKEIQDEFDYQVQFKDIGAENELCYVYIGKVNNPIVINKNEIADFKYIDYREISSEINKQSNCFTPWFKIEWERIEKEYLPVIMKL